MLYIRNVVGCQGAEFNVADMRPLLLTVQEQHEGSGSTQPQLRNPSDFVEQIGIWPIEELKGLWLVGARSIVAELGTCMRMIAVSNPAQTNVALAFIRR